MWLSHVSASISLRHMGQVARSCCCVGEESWSGLIEGWLVLFCVVDALLLSSLFCDLEDV